MAWKLSSNNKRKQFKNTTQVEPKKLIIIMNTATTTKSSVLDLKSVNLQEVNEHVIRYGSCTISELMYMDQQIRETTKNKSNLLLIFEHLIEQTRAKQDETNTKLLERVRNNFELYYDIAHAMSA